MPDSVQPVRTPLYVPMALDIALVNDQVRTGQAFQRWRFDYANLEKFISPEPDPFDGNTAANWPNEPGANGAYLLWQLPWGLRHGRQEDPTGDPAFPLTPNRWLVVRYSGDPGARTATGWVIESDFVDAATGTISFVDPSADDPTPTRIGRAIPVSQWSEPGGALFLTALGPGDATFTAFQPSVDNVFSFHDSLSGVADQDTLSYLVAGWYSDPSRDVLADLQTGETVAQALARLGWEVAQSGAEPDQTICHGMAYGLAWDRHGPPPPSARPDRPEQMTLAVGNTAIDALTAIVRQVPAVTGQDLDPDVLEAFQYGLLARYAEPEVHGDLWRAIHSAWFARAQGGYTWRIVDRTSDAATATDEMPPIDPAELAYEEEWLAELNRKQLALDRLSVLVQVQQRELYDLWWKRHDLPNLPIWPNLPEGVTEQDFERAFDYRNPQSAVARLYASLRELAHLTAEVPTGNTQEELQAAINTYVVAKELPPSRELKRAAEADFAAPNNPVVVIGGLSNPLSSQPDHEVQCRLAGELVAGFTFRAQLIDVASMAGKIPAPGVGALPDAIAPLLDDVFFLDPDNATLVASVALGDPSLAPAVAQVMTAHQSLDGVAPDPRIIPLTPWSQPWQPLFLMWEVQWYPIEYQATGGSNWWFDGEDYEWDGAGAALDRVTGLRGRIFLTPNLQFNMRARIEQYLNQHPDPPLLDIELLLDQVDGWDLMSQSLDGFQEQLVQRQPLAAVSAYGSEIMVPPDVTLPDLVGAAPRYAPDPGVFARPPFQPWPESRFEGMRAGQFCFTRLVVVDAFGQTAEIVDSQNSQGFDPVKADGCTPTHTVLPVAAQRFVQLPPRMQQPGRLRMDFVSGVDSGKVMALDPDVNPIVAWLLPNHLDGGISVFAPDGSALGEMRLAANADGLDEAVWFGAPHSPYRQIGDLAQLYPQLAGILSQFELTAGGTVDFAAFLAAIDETLWTVDPLGARDDQALSSLIGRPLALACARLKLELQGPPITDPTWRFTFDPRPAGYVDDVFSISLGNASIQRDGLVGYFVGTAYSTFYAAERPADAPPYVQPIGPGTYIEQSFADEDETFVTLLIDPRADVNAYSGLLPAARLALPQPMVDAGLAAMDVAFSVGPILSDTTIIHEAGAFSGETELAISIPLPSVRHGTWSWLERDHDVWTEIAVTPAGQVPRLSAVAPTLRYGLLRLSGGIASKK